MIGCEKDDSNAGQIRQVISMMAHPEKIFFCGQLGNGAAAKISNNYLSGTFLLSIAEAFAIGIRNGLDKNVLADVISNSSGMSWMSEHMNPVPGVIPTAPSSNGYKPGFRHELMVKDLTLGVEAGNKVGIEPSMGKTAVQASQRATKDPRTKVSICTRLCITSFLTIVGPRCVVCLQAGDRRAVNGCGRTLVDVRHRPV
jgi:3-hydroxyisobutyrate dehydrogenase